MIVLLTYNCQEVHGPSLHVIAKERTVIHNVYIAHTLLPLHRHLILRPKNQSGSATPGKKTIIGTAIKKE